MSYSDIYKSTLYTDERGNPQQRPGGHHGEYMNRPTRALPEGDVSEGVVTGAIDNIICQKEANMDQTTPNLTGRNIPAHVEATTPAKKEPKDVKTFELMGNTIQARIFEGGFTSLNLIRDGKVVLTANKTEFGRKHTWTDAAGVKHTIQSFGDYNGFLSALIALKAARPDSVYLHGIHRAGGIESLRNVWDWNKEMEPLYVRWSFVDAEGEKLLNSYGITRPTDAKFLNTWLTYKPERRLSNIRFFRVMPDTWDEFNAEMEAKGVSRDESYAIWKREHDDNQHDWNIINKHDGMEVALMLTEGLQFIYLHPFTANEDKGARLALKVEKLWTMDVEALREDSNARNEYYNTQRRVLNAAARIEKDPSYKFTEYAADVNSIAVLLNGEVKVVAITELVGKDVEFVYADGTPSDFFTGTKLYNVALVQPAADLAANNGLFLAVVG